MNRLLNALQDATNRTYTENGALAYYTTGSALLDFFAQGGAMRNRAAADIIRAFSRAFAEDPLLAMKALFYFRDVRGGQGERRLFRVIARYLAEQHPEVLKKNLRLIPEYGRWDDLYCLVDTPLEKDAFMLMKEQFFRDLSSDHPSLLAKWLKSRNTSSRMSRKLAGKTRRYFGLPPKTYDKLLAMLRDKIRVVEDLMSHNQWSKIEFDKVPSVAHRRYRNAFYRHEPERYSQYLEAVRQGQSKINTATLYPYELVEQLPMFSDHRNPYKINVGFGFAENEDVLNLMWENLPDYYNGQSENALVVADTSGSMRGRPIAVALSLALYAAERNKGPWHGHFITFSKRPHLQKIEGSTFCERIRNMATAEWDMNTDIMAVFRLILETAKQHGLSQEDMPHKIYIVSDMEFDAATGGQYNETLFETIRRQYEEAGYRLPVLIFWNVNARNQQFPAIGRTGEILISGCSPSIFRQTLRIGPNTTARDLMLEVLNDPRYSLVTV